MLVDGPVGVMLPGTMVATVFRSGSCRAAASKISLAGLEGVGVGAARSLRGGGALTSLALFGCSELLQLGLRLVMDQMQVQLASCKEIGRSSQVLTTCAWAKAGPPLAMQTLLRVQASLRPRRSALHIEGCGLNLKPVLSHLPPRSWVLCGCPPPC